MGLEQHPGGGLTCGRIGWWRRTPLSGWTFRRRRRSRWVTVRCWSGSSPRACVAAICPGFRGAKGRLPGDVGTSAAEMDGFPIHEIVGEVVASRHRSHGIGDRVVGWASGFDGLMEYVVADGDGLATVRPRADPAACGGAATTGLRAVCARAASEAQGSARRRDRSGLDRAAVLLCGKGFGCAPRHRRRSDRPRCASPRSSGSTPWSARPATGG